MNKIFRGAHFTGFIYGSVLLILIHVVGTLGYRFIGGPSVTWIDGFYMIFITIASIGFGEIVDLSQHPMVRPHAVNFMDQILRTDEGLRIEELIVPADYPDTALAELVPKFRDYILMASPDSRERLERLLKRQAA